MDTWGKFELIEKLASGGMGEVFLARELAAPARVVALKRLHPHLADDDGFLTQFLDEARVIARLHHQNLVEVYDLGQAGGTLFISMEFVAGATLRELTERAQEQGRPMSPALAVYVAAQLCHGLGFAHARVDPATGQPLGIVHRDVSPQNVLIGFDGTVKLADFGIAKVADQRSQTLSGTVKGKHPYMSPEQAMGEAIDARTDLFALATVLYEVLTRRRLFKRENDVKTLEAVARCDVPAPSRVQGELPGALDAVLLKALARERDERFANAAALRTALEGAVPLASTAATELGRLATALFPERVARFAQLQAPPPLAPLYPPLAHDLKTERMAPVTAGDDPPTLRPEDPTLPPGTPALTEPSPRAQRETVTRPRAARPGATASASFDARAPLPPLGQPARPQTSTQTALTPTPGRARWLWPVVAALAGALGLAALAVLGAAAMGSDAPQPVACAATLHVGADAGVFVHSAAGVGTSFRLYGADGGAPAGVAMVIEALPGDEARLLTENPAALQPGMTACPLTTN